MRWCLLLAVPVLACAHRPPAGGTRRFDHPAPVRHPSPTGPPAKPHALLSWPVAPFTNRQIAETKSCDVTTLARARYAKGLAVSALPATFTPHNGCDQATLAAACGLRLKGAPPPKACLDAYRAAVSANPALAFVSVLTRAYFGRVPLVAPPPMASHALRRVVLEYRWDGLGKPVAWTLTVRDATHAPTVTITGAKAGKKAPGWATKVVALGASLGSFLPIPRPLHAIDCTDNYPHWTATLTFDDGSILVLDTHGSNLFPLGGPWQMRINGITYLQLAPDFTRAVGRLVEAFALPIGEPAGAFCHGYDLEHAVLPSGR